MAAEVQRGAPGGAAHCARLLDFADDAAEASALDDLRRAEARDVRDQDCEVFHGPVTFRLISLSRS